MRDFLSRFLCKHADVFVLPPSASSFKSSHRHHFDFSAAIDCAFTVCLSPYGTVWYNCVFPYSPVWYNSVFPQGTVWYNCVFPYSPVWYNSVFPHGTVWYNCIFTQYCVVLFPYSPVWYYFHTVLCGVTVYFHTVLWGIILIQSCVM